MRRVFDRELVFKDFWLAYVEVHRCFDIKKYLYSDIELIVDDWWMMYIMGGEL